MVNHRSDIIGITETKLRSNREPTTNINIPGYKTYSTCTEAGKGGKNYVQVEAT